MTNNYTITFATYNQLDYTKKFIASLDRQEVDFSRIVAVDNGSTDGTREWLAQQGFGAVILNNRNLGCGAAWNQGAMAIQSEWTIVMNNDVVCAKGWLHGLLNAAHHHPLDIVSPALIEGDLDYDFSSFSSESRQQMDGYCRKNTAHAVCLMIQQGVWEKIGYFMPIPRLLGYEDTIFFQRAKEQKLAIGITSESWLHHFGSITQKAIQLETQIQGGLGDRHLMRQYMRQSWLNRKVSTVLKTRLIKNARALELGRYGKTVHMLRRGGAFEAM